MRLPKGSDFLLQMHFHLSGKPESEKSLIGIYFAEKPPEKNLFHVGLPSLFGVRRRHRHSSGRIALTIKDSFTLPGRHRRLLGGRARALPGEGDEGDGHAA